MKSKKIIIFILVLFLLCGCTKEPINSPTSPTTSDYTVEYYDYFGNLIKEETISSIEDFDSFTIDNVTIGNRNLEFYKWNLDINQEDKTIKASSLYIDSLEKGQTKYTNLEVFKNSLLPDVTNHILVFFISFKDEPEIDREAFEDMFIGEYGQDNCLKSLSSYYKYNSYGQDLFDYTFVYYQSDMTVDEAWHYVNDEDSYGSFVGNQFLFDIFTDSKKKGLFDAAKLDADKDGFVDASVFIIGDDLNNTKLIYGGAQGHTSSFEYPANINSPNIGNYVKVSNFFLSMPLVHASGNHEGIRTVVHEFGHLFGLIDYYDMMGYKDTFIDTLGTFDMQSFELGDWNPFSKFTCGWLKPYVITEDMETVTIKLRCSSIYNDAILIPTSLGWNGTAFDEYLLVDVMAPEGANGYDWEALTGESERKDHRIHNKNGGIRILHVDARLLTNPMDDLARIDNIDEAVKDWKALRYAYINSNGYKPEISTDSNFYHIVDWIPKNGSSQFRINTPTKWSTLMLACTNDLFSQDDVFSIETHKDAFPNGELANNGGTFNYSIRVDYYDPELMEAIVTITKNN